MVLGFHTDQNPYGKDQLKRACGQYADGPPRPGISISREITVLMPQAGGDRRETISGGGRSAFVGCYLRCGGHTRKVTHDHGKILRGSALTCLTFRRTSLRDKSGRYMSKSIMISFLSTSLDGGTQDKRRTKWRPNVGVALASEPEIDRMILLYEKKDEDLAYLVKDDANRMRSDFDVQLIETSPSSSNLSSTYRNVLRLSDVLRFDPADQYYLNITTCTPIQQICFCTLAESRAGRWISFNAWTRRLVIWLPR